MPSGFQELAPSPAIAYRDESATVSVTASASNLVIVTLRTGPGLKWFITSFRQAWASGIDGTVTYSLRINGVAYPPYINSTVQIAPPEQDVDLPVPIPVEQLSLIEMTASGATGMATGNVTGRIVIKGYQP